MASGGPFAQPHIRPLCSVWCSHVRTLRSDLAGRRWPVTILFVTPHWVPYGSAQGQSLRMRRQFPRDFSGIVLLSSGKTSAKFDYTREMGVLSKREAMVREL